MCLKEIALDFFMNILLLSDDEAGNNGNVKIPVDNL